MNYKLFDINIEEKYANELKITLLEKVNFKLNLSEEDLLNIDDLYEKYTFGNSYKVLNERLINTIIDFLNDNNIEHQIINSISNILWNKTFKKDDNDSFNLNKFNNKILISEIKKLTFEDIANTISYYDSSSITNNYYVLNDTDKENCEDIYNHIKSNYFENQTNLFTLLNIEKFYSIIKLSENLNSILILSNKNNDDNNYTLKNKTKEILSTMYLSHQLNKFSLLINLGNIKALNLDKSLTLDDNLNNTSNAISEYISKDDEAFVELDCSSTFKSIINNESKITINNFKGYIKNCNAHKYKECTKTKEDIYFVLIEIYLTYVKLHYVYEDINSLMNIFKNYIKSQKYISLISCNDKILELYNFNNIFPEKSLDTYLVLIFSLYLDTKVDNVKFLISKMLDKNSSRLLKKEYLKTFENIDINFKAIIEYIDNN